MCSNEEQEQGGNLAPFTGRPQAGSREQGAGSRSRSREQRAENTSREQGAGHRQGAGSGEQRAGNMVPGPETREKA